MKYLIEREYKINELDIYLDESLDSTVQDEYVLKNKIITRTDEIRESWMSDSVGE